MKIGLSFSRCIKDVVDGKVSIHDILVIVARTMFEKEHIEEIIKNYILVGDIPEDKFDRYVEVATQLYDLGKIHQPRNFGNHSHYGSAFYTWFDLTPSSNDMSNPALVEAWENYKIVLALTNE